MKQGLAFHIRFNPQDIMTAIDICQKAGIYMKGMSLASIMRVAASSCFEQLRQQGKVPEREGFEYSAMVAPYVGANDRASRAVRAAVGQQMGALEVQRYEADMPPVRAHGLQSVYTRREEDIPHAGRWKPGTREYRKALDRLREIALKIEANDPNVTPEMLAEHEQLRKDLAIAT